VTESLRKNAPCWSALTHYFAYRDPWGKQNTPLVCTMVSTDIDFR
jgi:hypothetical protein